eukprot:CAMPEP_0206140836 /NCGR_PEP_ID=MMETSP1473-20131121/10794_1 /ASSEMBLY_ACC=CAM_ASM_001109 /TAXON_ID=1461547 /ORGANISM="Stichococcus sp, Strain RCC1054" /LENGTH=311 /DNA_ID=CAMNT_0053535151 /DNA_START=248 /DNA_END=1184 /DNA_ORIENTATION=+
MLAQLRSLQPASPTHRRQRIKMSAGCAVDSGSTATQAKSLTVKQHALHTGALSAVLGTAAAILVSAPLHASELQDSAFISTPVYDTQLACELIKSTTAGRAVQTSGLSATGAGGQQQGIRWPAKALVTADLNPLNFFRPSPPPPPQRSGLLPHIENPFAVLGYLLQNPVAALAVGGGAAFIIPRLVRTGVRFVLVPAVLLLAGYIAFSNPQFIWTAATGVTSTVATHPVATSAVILIGSSLMLSPYILLAVLALVLTTGTKILPPFLRPALPGPVSEVFKQVDAAQGQARSAFDQVVGAVRPAPALKDGGR